jgi:hypothetical protein
MESTQLEAASIAERYDHKAFKMIGVISPRLDHIVAANTVGHMLVALGASVGPTLLGQPHRDADDQEHARLARFPFILLAARPGKISRIVAEAQALAGVTIVDYPEEGYTTTHDDDYGAALAARKAADLVHIGAALFGPAHEIDGLCGRLSLWRPQ